MGREIGTAEDQTDFGDAVAEGVAALFAPFVIYAVVAGFAIAFAPLYVGYFTLQLVFKGWGSWSRKKR